MQAGSFVDLDRAGADDLGLGLVGLDVPFDLIDGGAVEVTRMAFVGIWGRHTQFPSEISKAGDRS